MSIRISMFACLALTAAAPLAAQRIDQLSAGTRRFVAVPEPVVAITNVTVIDGTGAAPKPHQTVLIREGRIAAVGPASSTSIPTGARSIDGTGQTLIPGLVGMHDHLFYMAAGGRNVNAQFTSTRLYLAGGVTTVRTTGANSAYADIKAKADVDAGRMPGPRIHLTAPYLTGHGNNGDAVMAVAETPEQARRFVDYWADEGATWLKAYTDISRENLGAAIAEAHRRGLKVTGHLCSVSYREAVALGIDNLEHGLFTASDFATGRGDGQCPADQFMRAGAAEPGGELWQDVIRTMIDANVAMTGTLAVIEPFVPRRPTADPRALEAMAPEVREAYMTQRRMIDSTMQGIPEPMFLNAMAFEKAFHDAGGLLAAGVDPTGIGGALPGYGDQRNYELFIEAGFTPGAAIQVMTLNGARILGVDGELGSIETGKLADLVLLPGDLAADAAVINSPRYVFKDGVGYDPAPLIASVKGRVGIN
ncbi:MAG TPA: amidohydrolase family protein [Gemmatimonadales bacterium]|nr:amidohydrolase family protein [Gemmatimonadales bacterium]